MTEGERKPGRFINNQEFEQRRKDLESRRNEQNSTLLDRLHALETLRDRMDEEFELLRMEDANIGEVKPETWALQERIQALDEHIEAGFALFWQPGPIDESKTASWLAVKWEDKTE
jgi:hypothetical protein